MTLSEVAKACRAGDASTVPRDALKRDVRQRRRLMNDHLGLGARDRLMDGPSVKRIEHDRLRTELAQPMRLFRRVAGANLMAALEQLRNQPAADRATNTFIVLSLL